MNCDEFEQRLQERLDHRLVPHSLELRSHAETCAPCNLSLRNAGLLSRGIAAWRTELPLPSIDLTDRITRQLSLTTQQPAVVPQPQIRVERQPTPSEPSHSWQSWTVLAGTVAAVWFVFAGSGPQRPDRDTRIVKSKVQPQGPSAKADLGAVLVSAEGAYSKLATESFAAAQDFALLWPSSTGLATADSMPAAVNAADSMWTPDLSRELTPIGNSVGEALDFLSRTVPRIEKAPL